MKLFTVVAALFTLVLATGCSNQAARDYYLAVQKSADAQARQAEARYKALATVASNGDEGSSVAATMAIALTQDRAVVPQYVESSALKWTQALAGPAAAIAGIAIQADVAKNASNNARDVQLANYASNEAIQLGQQNMVLGLGANYAQAGAAATDALVGLGKAGFDALNTAGEQTAGVANTGFDAVTTVSNNGMDNIYRAADRGFDSIDTMSGTHASTTSQFIAAQPGSQAITCSGDPMLGTFTCTTQ